MAADSRPGRCDEGGAEYHGPVLSPRTQRPEKRKGKTEQLNTRSTTESPQGSCGANLGSTPHIAKPAQSDERLRVVLTEGHKNEGGQARSLTHEPPLKTRKMEHGVMIQLPIRSASNVAQSGQPGGTLKRKRTGEDLGPDEGVPKTARRGEESHQEDSDSLVALPPGIAFTSHPSILRAAGTGGRAHRRFRVHLCIGDQPYQSEEFVHMNGGDMVLLHLAELRGAVLLGRIAQYEEHGQTADDAQRDLEKALEWYFDYSLRDVRFKEALDKARTEEVTVQKKRDLQNLLKRCSFCAANFLDCSRKTMMDMGKPCDACVNFNVVCEHA
ncbi:hypothetical protein K490DRAFT_54682 [Saccharata proteae CBS 121410]|uniref:Uncharacterized protein n=1 Tax=Saccharata proteae CBS 121410 TaxID=1314787 RepID=A0A9P4I0H8_9PEZI|nr:hypothetical protein K490DRAFT_54682 [Saccharata proteae CBS 121410]